MPKIKPLKDPKIIRSELDASRIEARRNNIAETSLNKSEAYEAAAALSEDEDLRSDWKHLVDIAKVKFPEHLALKFQLKPPQRVCAIGHIIGWTTDKMARASGQSQRTIQRWLSHELVQEFIKAVQYHEGSRDNKELIDTELYSSILVIKELRDNPIVKAETRLAAAKWFYEQKYGKPKETQEVKSSVNIKDLTEQLMRSKTEPTDFIESQEDDISKNRTVN